MHALAAHVTCRKAVTAGLLTALLGACSANPAGEPIADPPARSAPQPAAPVDRTTAGASAPTAGQPQSPAKPVPCPSRDFGEFLKAFANRGDVRLAYSNQPFKSTVPYYWIHNTRPGDPRYPKWLSHDTYGIPDLPFNYNYLDDVYVHASSGEEIKEGDIWHPKKQTGSRRMTILNNFKITRQTPSFAEVESMRGQVDRFQFRDDCWYYMEGADLSESDVVNCKWPEGCEGILEHEEKEE